ncbi:MAG: SCO family protein [Parvularculaceae bacterium]
MGRFLLLLALVLGLAACGEKKPSVEVPSDAVMRLSDLFTGDFALIDKNGAHVADEDFEGKVTLVYFGYTSCPDVCPGDIGVMSATLNELGSDAKDLAVLFVTVDPERDTPQALADYFAFDERIVPLTGTPDAAAAARAAFKQVAIKKPGSTGPLGYTVDHLRLFYVLDRAGVPQIAVKGGVSPQVLAEILRREMRR